MTIKIKKLSKDAIPPKFIREGDAAMDIYSSEDTIIPPNERKIIGTGIAMAVPNGYAGLIWDRGGCAAKYGLKIMGGVLDSNYRGEIKIILHNLSKEDFRVEKGMRIAQMLIQKIEQKNIELVEELDDTNRGEGRFNSSGLK
jgi:dUTP pyrophosphatase